MIRIIITIISIIMALMILISYYKKDKREKFEDRGVVLFFSPGCSHCTQFRPVWNKLKNEFRNNSIINVREVDGSKDGKEVNKYDIDGFPTVVYINNGMVKDTYMGDRSYESLKLFFQKST